MIMHCANPPESSLLDNAVSAKFRMLAHLVSVQVADFVHTTTQLAG